MAIITDGTRTISEQEATYKSLYKLKTYKKSQPIPLYVQTNEAKIERVVLGILGSGGSKRAYELEGGTALLMPYGGSLSSIASSEKWSEMVDEEIMGASRVKELGLLACELEKTTVFMTNDSTIGVPAYLTETFKQLALKEMWIIDQKNPRSSTWDKSLFHETTDSLDEKKWEKALNPFLKDIAKLLANNFWLYIDNVNMVVLEKSDQNDDVKYEVRYFGFDFSSKYGSLSFKKLSSEEISSRVPFIVGDSLLCLMDCEFGDKWNEQLRNLRENLREKCITQVLSEITLQTSC
jgi:hypothetical protein